MIVNAGAIPRDHWTQDVTVGGGRIVGEGCHFVDLARFLVGSPITSLSCIAASTSAGVAADDVASLSLGFADGSIASIQYLANGAKSFPKERVDCFYDGRALTIDNWRRLTRYGVPRPLLNWPVRQDKGHRAEIAAWVAAIRNGGPSPIPHAELFEVSRWSIRAGILARGGEQA